MDSAQIQKYVEKIAVNAIRVETQKAYSIGNHPAILQPVAKPDPDNRKPVPFARRAVAMLKGYMAKPGNIKYSGDYYDSTLKPIYDSNDEELTTANELEDALVHGSCYELHWLEDGYKQFYPIPVAQCLPIYSTDLRPKLIGFVWARTLPDETVLVTVYDDTNYQEWSKSKKDSVFVAGPELPHGYGVVPVNVGHIDRDARNLFDHVLPLIDLYDKLISEDVANEAARFNAAIMLMAERIDALATDDNGRTMIDRLKEMRLIDGLAPDGSDVRNKVAFVTRDIPTEFIRFAAEQTERLIYEMLMIVNPNDDNFATVSGVAQAYKLLGMEYLASSIEAYFGRFLQNRIKIIAGISGSLGEDSTGASDVTITFNRNLPHNIAETAETMAKLKGLVSDETLLRLLPSTVIPDIEAELEKIGEMESMDDIASVTDEEMPDDSESGV